MNSGTLTPAALLEHPGCETFRLEGRFGALDHDLLDAEVSRVATRLQEQLGLPSLTGEKGVSGAVVLAERSRSSTVVLLFALWRLGFVPLMMESSAPKDRVLAAFKALSPALILAHDKIGTAESIPVLGDHWNASKHPSSDKFSGCPDPAYVAMTSGSTGTPLLTLCRWSGAAPVASCWATDARLTSASRVLQFSSPTYDAYFTELLPTLLTGGTLVCLDDDSWSKPRRLAEGLAQRRITHITIPPSYATRLFATGKMPHIEFLGLAGERLDSETAEAACAHASSVINAYGPSEATVCVCTQEVGPGMSDIPLGTPWPHVLVSIEDGQIILGGPSVAWGYLGDPEEATRFQTDRRTGQRLLSTGDLGELRGGKLYFHGRRDGQVKLSGHRADLKSIEWTIRKLAGVTDCVVILAGGKPACLVVSERPVNELTAEIRAKLPPAEWPSAWRQVHAIPYLSSDKVDLAAAAKLLTKSDEVIVPDSDLGPSWLVSSWREQAQLTVPTDEFFSSGGDSLGAMALLDAIYDASSIDIDVVEFLESPTFEWLCHRINGRSNP